MLNKEKADGGEVKLPVSLRDWFAGQAMAALLSNTEAMDSIHDRTPGVKEGCDMLAWAAYLHADSMLAKREAS